MKPFNRIITRGMGSTRDQPSRSGMITQGYGGPLVAVREVIKRIIRVGQSGTKRAIRELEEIIVWAKLIDVNDVTPKAKIEGSIRVRINKSTGYAISLVEHVSTRVRKAWEDIKISVKRIK